MKKSIKYIITRVFCSLLVALTFWFIDTYLVHAETCKVAPRIKSGSCEFSRYGSAPAKGVSAFAEGVCTKGSSFDFQVSCGGTDNITESVSCYGACTLYTSIIPVEKGQTSGISFNDYTIRSSENLLPGYSYYTFAEWWDGYSEYYGSLTSKKAGTAYSSNLTPSTNGSLTYFRPSTQLYLEFNSDSYFNVVFHTDKIDGSNGENLIINTYNSVVGGLTNSKIDEANSKLDEQNSKLDEQNSKLDEQNSKLDEQNSKLDEQNETSKGIWGSLKDGISSIGNWFTDLAHSIKVLFVGEEVCENEKRNYFIGYDQSNITPNSEGWITLDVSTTGSYKEVFYYSKKLENLPEKKYNIFLEIKDFTYTGNGGYFAPVYSVSSKRAQIGSAFTFEHGVLSPDVIKYDSTHVKTKNNVYNWQEDYKVSSSDNYFNVLTAMARSGGASIHATFRVLITDDTSITLDNYEYFTVKKECHTEGGLFGMISNLISSISGFFTRLFSIFEDTDVSGSTSDGQSFFEGFEDKDYGLSDVVSMPLVYIGKISTTTCTPLVLPLPFVEQDVTLPCMNEIYKKYFGSFLTIYQTITFGIIAYWICINTFAMVKGFKNPDDDRIEVMEL